MFPTLRTVGFFLRHIFISRLKAKRALKAYQSGDKQPGYEMLSDLSRRVLIASGSRIVYHGLENLPEEKGVLIVSNHQSYFDIPIIMQVMDAPTSFVAKKELSKVPGVGLWIRMTGGEFIDRADLRQSMQCILNTGEKLKDGQNMVIFPEGTRSRSDAHGEFKQGSLKPASIAKTSIVPVFIDGSYKIFENNKGVKVTPAEVHVYVGKAMPIAGLSRNEYKALAGSIEEIIFNLPHVVA